MLKQEIMNDSAVCIEWAKRILKALSLSHGLSLTLKVSLASVYVLTVRQINVSPSNKSLVVERITLVLK